MHLDKQQVGRRLAAVNQDDLNEVKQLLDLRHEHRNLEAKLLLEGAEPNHLDATVAKAAMALANQRDGGYLVLGVDHRAGQAMRVMGVSEEQLVHWLDDDVVTAVLAKYCDPAPRFFSAHLIYEQQSLVVLRIGQFDEHPILCKRDYGTVLHRHRIYTRRVGEKATSDPTHLELREMLDLATEARVRQLLASLQRTGIPLPGAVDQYKHERDTIALTLPTAYQNKGCWSIAIHPSNHTPDRISEPIDGQLGQVPMRSFLERATVRISGWPLPYIGDVQYGDRWIAETIDSPYHRISWRLHQSGQFQQRQLIYAQDPCEERGNTVDTWELVSLPYKTMQLAANMASLMPDVTAMTVTVALLNIGGATLTPSPDLDQDLRTLTTSSQQLIPRDLHTPVTELLADPAGPALDLTMQLMQGFGSPLPRRQVATYRAELINSSRGDLP